MILEAEAAAVALPGDSIALPAAAPASTAATKTRAESLVQSLVLVVLFSAPSLLCARSQGIVDPDIWWHLRTGQWILEHRALPHTDPFSSFAAGKPWQAYSWLFEVLVYQIFARLGLVSIVLFVGVMVAAITAALHHLVKRLQRDFSLVILLTAAGTLCLGHLFTPRPWLFTILFFIFELDILLTARRTGRSRELFWLPVIFALWANIHIQFIDGLLVLALAAAEPLLALRWPAVRPENAPRGHAAAIPLAFAASILATFLNPYGLHLYRIAYDLNAQPGVLNLIGELKAVPFRDVTDFTMLALALGACAVLARARHLLPFQTLLFAFAAFVSFRSQRDVWVMAIVAVALIASQLTGSEKARDYTRPWVPPIALGSALVIILIGFPLTGLTNPTLLPRVASAQPVKAVDFIKQQHLSGPLYNDFDWGGYLIYNLPTMPVSIDGRAALMGSEHIRRSLETISAQSNWASDPELARAHVILLPATSPLATVLRMDQRFHQVYQDDLAVVFTGSQPQR